MKQLAKVLLVSAAIAALPATAFAFMAPGMGDDLPACPPELPTMSIAGKGTTAVAADNDMTDQSRTDPTIVQWRADCTAAACVPQIILENGTNCTTANDATGFSKTCIIYSTKTNCTRLNLGTTPTDDEALSITD